MPNLNTFGAPECSAAHGVSGAFFAPQHLVSVPSPSSAAYTYIYNYAHVRDTKKTILACRASTKQLA